MADTAWTRYKLQRRLFSIGEDFWIENDQGEELYKVDGKALTLRETLVIEDKNEAELMTIEANRALGWSIAGIGNRLRTNPHEVQKLSLFRQAVEQIAQSRLQVLPQ